MMCRNREILEALIRIEHMLEHQQRQLSAITAVLTSTKRADTTKLAEAIDGLQALADEGSLLEEKKDES